MSSPDLLSLITTEALLEELRRRRKDIIVCMECEKEIIRANLTIALVESILAQAKDEDDVRRLAAEKGLTMPEVNFIIRLKTHGL